MSAVTAVAIGCLLPVPFLVLLAIRNLWVYRARMDLINANHAAYESLPSYDTMMRRFWIWDAARFVGQGERDRLAKARKDELSKRRGMAIVERARTRQQEAIRRAEAASGLKAEEAMAPNSVYSDLTWKPVSDGQQEAR